MKIRFGLVLPLLMLCLFGCDRQVASETYAETSETYTETKVEWQGATAEDIRDVVRSIAPGLQIAVIEDGEAILHHRGSVAETQKELDRYIGSRPDDLTVSTSVSKEGELPETPSQEERVQISWEVDSAEATAQGIRVVEITAHLRKLDFGQDEASAAEALHGETIKNPSGTKIPLNSLVEPKSTTVNRPIILTE